VVETLLTRRLKIGGDGGDMEQVCEAEVAGEEDEDVGLLGMLKVFARWCVLKWEIQSIMNGWMFLKSKKPSLD
jgi:hypothetical protein